MLHAQPGQAAIVGGVVCHSRIDATSGTVDKSPLVLFVAPVELTLPLLGNRCGVSF